MPTDLTLLEAPERNRYFYGLMMDADRFQQDQDYFNRKRYLLNRFVSGGGKLAIVFICRKTSAFDGSPWGITFWAISFVSQSPIWSSVSHSLRAGSSLICSSDLAMPQARETERTAASSEPIPP